MKEGDNRGQLSGVSSVKWNVLGWGLPSIT